MSGRLLFALCSAALSVAGTNAELSNAKNPLVDVHATVEGSTSSGLQNDLLQRKVGGRVVQPVMLVSLMAALLGLIFVVAHCVKNMGGQQTSEPRLVLRRLAEAGDPCSEVRLNAKGPAAQFAWAVFLMRALNLLDSIRLAFSWDAQDARCLVRFQQIASPKYL